MIPPNVAIRTHDHSESTYQLLVTHTFGNRRIRATSMR